MAITPTPRIGKYAASTKNPKPADSERQPRNAAWHEASENPPRRKPRKQPMGLINR